MTNDPVEIGKVGRDRLVLLRVPNIIGKGNRPARAVTGSLITAAWPAALNGVLELVHSRAALRTLGAWTVLCTFLVLQFCVLLLAQYFWLGAERGMPAVLGLVPSANQQKLVSWFFSWYRLVPQVLVGIGSAALGDAVLFLVTPTIQPKLEIGPMSYVSIAWSCALGGVALYTLARVARIVHALERLGPLHLDIWDPATTPGLRVLGSGYIGFLIVTVLMAGAIEEVAITISALSHSVVLSTFLDIFPVGAVLFGLFIGVLPQLDISRLTTAGKDRTIACIDRSIGDLGAALSGDAARLSSLLSVRAQVRSAPNLPVRMPWLLPLVGALIGPLLAYLASAKP